MMGISGGSSQGLLHHQQQPLAPCRSIRPTTIRNTGGSMAEQYTEEDRMGSIETGRATQLAQFYFHIYDVLVLEWDP